MGVRGTHMLCTIRSKVRQNYASIAAHLSDKSQLLQDLGFLSFTLPKVEILMPTKKPRGAELTLEQHLANQVLHQRRLRIEHVASIMAPATPFCFWTTQKYLA